MGCLSSVLSDYSDHKHTSCQLFCCQLPITLYVLMNTYHTTSNDCEEGSGTSGTIGSTYNVTRDGPAQQDVPQSILSGTSHRLVIFAFQEPFTHILIECFFTKQPGSHLVPQHHDFQSFLPGVAAVPVILLTSTSGGNNSLCSSFDPFTFKFHGLDNTPSDFGLPLSGYSLFGNNPLPSSAFNMPNNHLLLPPHQSTGRSDNGTGLPVLPLPDLDARSTTVPVSGEITDENGTVADTNTSTWSTRNPQCLIIPPHTSKPKRPLSEAECASCQIVAEQWSSR